MIKDMNDESFFENCIKKMYLEFTKESKVGGGGHLVQNTLRQAQNCFVELLSYDLGQSYQFGFLYIRQLCLHLRNTRNNMSGDAVKHIYSWQFFNCIKLWVLAVCRHKKELVLLINPLV
jgi:nucleolar complex protein 2